MLLLSSFPFSITEVFSWLSCDIKIVPLFFNLALFPVSSTLVLIISLFELMQFFSFCDWLLTITFAVPDFALRSVSLFSLLPLDETFEWSASTYIGWGRSFVIFPVLDSYDSLDGRVNLSFSVSNFNEFLPGYWKFLFLIVSR